MKWFYNLSKNARILITVAAWVLSVCMFAIASATQLSLFSALGAILLIVAIVFTVFAVKKKKGTSPAARETDKSKQPAVCVDTSRVEKDFFSKVVGVTFNNDDGSSRQQIISKLKAGDELVFRPVSVQGHPEAVGVFTTGGKQLGHLTAELAGELKNKYPTNPVSATVAQVTGGGDRSYGCNIHIVIYQIPKE